MSILIMVIQSYKEKLIGHRRKLHWFTYAINNFLRPVWRMSKDNFTFIQYTEVYYHD